MKDLVKISPWPIAKKWGKPKQDSDDGTDLLGWLSIVRAVLGLVILVAVGIYTPSRDPGQVLLEDGWEKSSNNVVFSMAAVPVFMIGTYLLTRRECRRDFTWRPTIGRILLMVLTTLGPMTPIILMGTGVVPAEGPTARSVVAGAACLIGIVVLWRYFPMWVMVLGILWAPFIGLAVFMAALAWLVAYILCVAFWASRTSCWAGLFHPLLAPTLSATVVGYFTVDALLTQNTGGVPVDLWLFLLLGGLVSTLTLVIAEYTMLRRSGYSWRNGPDPSAREEVRGHTDLAPTFTEIDHDSRSSGDTRIGSQSAPADATGGE